MYGCGLTINTMSLGGLAIGVGMVVDSSTVVLEAISIRRKAGEDPVALSISGTKEVLTSIFGSTITSCVVFLPIVFVEGLAAEIFREFALTISFSLVSSFFTSSTLVPVLSQFEFFRPKGNDFPKIIEDFRLRSLDSIRSFFERISIFFYVKKSRTFLICIVLVPLTIFLGFLIPTEILPEIDQGELEFSVVTPEGSSLEYTVSVVDRIGAALRSESKVGLAFSKVGYEERDIVLNPQGDFGLNRASIFVRLDSGKTKDFLESFRPHIEKIESDSGAKISSKLSGGVLSTIFSNDGGISLEISGQDLQIIKDTAIHSEKLIRSIPGNPEVKSSLREESPELRVVLDREKMSFFGLTVEDIATALKSAYKGDIATKFRENDFEFDVLVRFREADRFGFRSVPAIPIRLQSGKSVLLGTLANIVPSNALRKITRMNGRRVAILSVSHPGISENKLEEGIADIAKSYVKKQDISVLPGELQKESAKSFAALYWAGAFAVLLIYMTLASQFENLILPLVVMLSVVMVGVGSLSLLILTKNTLSIISGMGMVMLTGLVVNNAIILIEFFMQGNASLDEEELLRSTVRRRIDTILNTTLTTVLGLLPAALSLGGDSPQEPMALAVIGGLTASTVLSVAIIPSAYFALRRSKK